MIAYGSGILNSLINKLPIELHLPNYQFCGPGTKLEERLARGVVGINPLDSTCKEHDIIYSQNHNNLKKRNLADKVLAEKAWQRVKAKDSSLKGKVYAYAVTNIMKAKSKLGMGLGKKKKIGKMQRMVNFKTVVNAARKSMNKKSKNGRFVIKSALTGARKIIKKKGGKKKFQIPKILAIPTAIGGALPLIPIFAGLSALGALTNGISGVAKALNETKSAKHQLDEATRHNKMMESIAMGGGLYLRPYKTGSGIKLRLHNEKKKTSINSPNRALTNIDLIRYAKVMKIPHFRGVFMQNSLPVNGPRANESAIINLDHKTGLGTHWVAYRKIGKNVTYFDSFGNLKPPKELVVYLKVQKIKYNYERYQKFDTFNCGHLCLKFLSGYK